MAYEQMEFQILEYLYKLREPRQEVLGKIFTELEYEDWFAFSPVYEEMESRGEIKVIKNETNPTALLMQPGIDRLMKLKVEQGNITQADKREMVVRYLFSNRGQKELVQVFKDLGIFTTKDEVWMIGDWLAREELIDLDKRSGNRYMAKIDSKGIDYCEGSLASGANPGNITTNHYHVSGHGNNFISASQKVNIRQRIQVGDTASNIIQAIKDALPRESALSEEEKQEIRERLSEVEEKIANQLPVRKHNIMDMLSIAGNTTQVSGFLLQLGQLLNIIS